MVFYSKYSPSTLNYLPQTNYPLLHNIISHKPITSSDKISLPTYPLTPLKHTDRQIKIEFIYLGCDSHTLIRWISSSTPLIKVHWLRTLKGAHSSEHLYHTKRFWLIAPSEKVLVKWFSSEPLMELICAGTVRSKKE